MEKKNLTSLAFCTSCQLMQPIFHLPPSGSLCSSSFPLMLGLKDASSFLLGFILHPFSLSLLTSIHFHFWPLLLFPFHAIFAWTEVTSFFPPCLIIIFSFHFLYLFLSSSVHSNSSSKFSYYNLFCHVIFIHWLFATSSSSSCPASLHFL